MKYVIDIDGTLCSQEKDYSAARPYPDIIRHVNDLYGSGNIIWLFTSRGSDTGISWLETTVSQLEEWGVKYHKLLFSKPSADKYIDDKAVNVADMPW